MNNRSDLSALQQGGVPINNINKQIPKHHISFDFALKYDRFAVHSGDLYVGFPVN